MPQPISNTFTQTIPSQSLCTGRKGSPGFIALRQIPINGWGIITALFRSRNSFGLEPCELEYRISRFDVSSWSRYRLRSLADERSFLLSRRSTCLVRFSSWLRIRLCNVSHWSIHHWILQISPYYCLQNRRYVFFWLWALTPQSS